MKSSLILLLAICLLQSCKTYNYTYDKKESSLDGKLVSYYNPKIEENYSIVPYVSVLGIGLGGGYLLGNHVHDNMISAGSPVDTAETSRNIIYLLGAAVAGYGFYYLYNDSSAQKANYVNYNRQEITEWYANVVDYEKYRLLGHSKGWINVINDNNISKLKTGNYKELLKIYKSFVRNSDYPLRDSIIVSSFELLPEKYHYSLYKATGSQYDIYLSSYPNYLDEFIELISYAKAVKKTNIKNRDRYLSNVAEKTFQLLNESKDTTNIIKWMNVFGDLKYSDINTYKQNLKQMVDNKENEELQQKANKIKTYFKDLAFKEVLYTLDQNHPILKDEKMMKILNLPILFDGDLDKILVDFKKIYDNLLNNNDNYKTNKEELDLLKKRSERMLRLNKYMTGSLKEYIYSKTKSKILEPSVKQFAKQIMIIMESRIDKFYYDLNKITANYEEELENRKERKRLEEVSKRLIEFKKYSKMKKGSCIKVGHRISGGSGVTSMINLLTDGSSTGYWYQADLIDVKKSSIIVKIQILLGGLSKEDEIKNKWVKGQIVEIVNPNFIKKCY